MPLLACLLTSPPAASEDQAPSERVDVAPPVTHAGDNSNADGPTKSASTSAPADDSHPTPEADEAKRKGGWQAEVFVDVAWGFNSNSPNNHVYRGMFTNPRTNELAVNNVGAFIRHPAREGQPWIFELGFHAGAAVDALTSGEPIPGGDDGKFAGSEVFKHIALGNVGIALPKAKTVFAAGVFEGPMGIGSFWTRHNWNYTTTWESNLVPYYLAGAKIAQPLPAGFELSGWVVNGFQSYADLNSAPSGLVGLTWTRGPTPVSSPRSGETALSLATYVYFGPEGTSLEAKDWLVYWDTWAIYDFDDHFSLAAVWDLGVDRAGRANELQSLYTGGALFARGTVFEGKHAKVDLAVRPEASLDRDGRFFGVDQWLISGTGTASLQLYDHLLVRAEYRYDHSTATNGFFYQHELGGDDDVGLATDQHTVFLSLTGWWDFFF
ncbi:outer membrane beta-barrel protein [Enhygromyxa salina]|nr:outer membrane beta-barrel protein [Enhygromyxa salina]